MLDNVPVDLLDTTDSLVSIERTDVGAVGELDDRSKRVLAFTHELDQTIQSESVDVTELIPLVSKNAGERGEMVVSEADVRFVVSNSRSDFLMNPRIFEIIAEAGGDVVTVWVKPRDESGAGWRVLVYARFSHLHD